MRAAASDKRRLKRINERHENSICFACRQKGHAASQCPSTLLPNAGEAGVPHAKAVVGICYRYAKGLWSNGSALMRSIDVVPNCTPWHVVESKQTLRTLCHLRTVSCALRKAILLQHVPKTRKKVSTLMAVHASYAGRPLTLQRTAVYGKKVLDVLLCLV